MGTNVLQHRDLTGNMLHEPKGADTADTDTTIVADGVGGTVWKKLEISQLDFEAPIFVLETKSSLPDDISIEGTGLSAATDGVLYDASTFKTTNKNIKELFLALVNTQARVELSSDNIDKLFEDVKKIKDALDDLGILKNE